MTVSIYMYYEISVNAEGVCVVRRVRNSGVELNSLLKKNLLCLPTLICGAAEHCVASTVVSRKSFFITAQGN